MALQTINPTLSSSFLMNCEISSSESEWVGTGLDGPLGHSAQVSAGELGEVLNERIQRQHFRTRVVMSPNDAQSARPPGTLPSGYTELPRVDLFRRSRSARRTGFIELGTEIHSGEPGTPDQLSSQARRTTVPGLWIVVPSALPRNAPRLARVGGR